MKCKIIDVYDANGEKITSRIDKVEYVCDCEIINVHLMDEMSEFNKDEIGMLIRVLTNEIESGVHISYAKEYFKLIDKLEKIAKRKHYK